MENRFKLRISRMFRSSFGSCRSKNITDVIERPVFSSDNNHQPHQNHHQLIELFSPKRRPFRSMCRPKWPENFQTEQACIISKNLSPRTKISEKRSLLLAADVEGQRCPPASPISPFNNYYGFQDSMPNPSKVKRSKTAIKKRVRSRTRGCGIHEFPACSYNGLFSSDEENDIEEDDDDKTTFFSSRSFSSDSSESLRRHRAAKTSRRRRPAATSSAKKESETSPTIMPLEANLNDSFAVVKRSSEPYNDFRTSMVEMIIEKQIFAAQDLENLLQCFLYLNSHHHHRVIIEVFTEIWEALFSDWS